MGNPLPRTQSLGQTRAKGNSGPKWDSFNKTNRPHSLFSNRHMTSTEKVRSFMSGELTSTGRPRAFLSGELPLVRPVTATSLPSMRDAATNTDLNDAATNTDDCVSISGDDGRSARGDVQDKREDRPVERRELLSRKNRDNDASTARAADASSEGGGGRGSSGLRRSASVGVSTTTSIQTEKEGSHSRLLSRGGESSSFRGRHSSSSRREVSGSFRKDTVSSSFRKEVVQSSRRKSTKSFQDGEVSSIASESARGSPCSIHYNQGPFSAKTTPQPLNSSWISETPSSPEGFYSSVPFHWEEAPGKAKTIAAAAEMALARKLSRDESLRKLSAASPGSSVDCSVQGERKGLTRHSSLEPPISCASPALPLPPSKREFSRELPAPVKKDPHASQLIEELKAAVVRKQAEDLMTRERAVEREDDNKSVISDFGPAEEAHIDLVAPSAAKFLTQEDDLPVLTPIKTPAAVPFKWEEAPGKPKGGSSPPPEPEPPLLTLPPRLLGGCRNLSKEAQAKILQTYSCNLSEMHWTASGNPTPLSRSRDHTPTRRDRTPTRRDRTPTRRDTTPTRRDITPSRRDSTPTRSYFNNVRLVPKSGPMSFPPAIPVIDNVRDYHSGPLRPNTVGPNYLNAPPRSISQEFALPIVVPPRTASQEFHLPKNPTQDNAINVLTQELSLSGPSSEESGRRGYASKKASREFPLPPRHESPAQGSQHDSNVAESSNGKSSNDGQSAAASSSAKPPAGAVDQWSPTSILCGPDLSVDTNRSNSNLSAYAESSHSQRQSVTSHTKSNSCSSEESFVDEIYDQQPWSGSITPIASPYRDLGPIDNPPESTQGNKALEEGVKALVKFCRKAKKWNKSKTPTRKNSQEPDMWAPTLATYFQKLELGGAIISKVGSQVFPDDRSLRSIYASGEASVARSPAKFIPRSGELGTPDRLALRRALGGQTPIQTIATCRSPTYRVLATDECFSLFSVHRVWNSTKARHAKWGKKMRRSSRVMVSVCAALKRSLMLKCGRHNLPTLPSESKLLSREDLEQKENAVHALSASHQFHRPL
ncbi:hypothetical protein MPTK1_8g08670 [Marchantia polymorpha subsp. ruderalis]|uniref:Uncharacterized protein n=1 Tax=Marchantia polymorpha TaxID=3197 RepID=A0A2R6WRN3_MARPO|nr:hypothetical protein MARPO_0063s0052 [Marchantia polymorpha]BBN19206.1 hypothetical protein Mp_8g08670 [Marchantia polymorpha subsp. ruderalis]|eukprot:PTQ36506.1 hypothetical protein MARPO_0063s0052 [Marchantia polymorpha]